MSDFADVWPLLEALADGEWVSGAQLAQDLNISREALSRRMRKLQEQFSLPLQSQVGRGYRLEQSLQLIDSQLLIQALAPELQASEIQILRSTDSTNRQLSMQAQMRVCLAEHQSAGRGRRGRDWHSPLGQNLYLSLKHELDHWPSRLPALGLVLGVALCQALQRAHAIPMQLKWPNDLYLNGKKCAGMLIEQRGEAQSHCQLIIGLGMNIHMQKADIDQSWTSLQAEGFDTSRTEMAALVIQSLMAELKALDDKRIADRLNEFSDFDVFAGQPVKLMSHDDEILGLNKGVDEWGRLRLQTSAGEQLISVGDISLRQSS